MAVDLEEKRTLMDLEVISDFDQFLSCRSDWNALLERSGIQNPFLRHAWLSAWWKGYGQDKDLMVLRCHRDGKTTAYIPLMRYETTLTGIKVDAMGFLTNHWTRMDIITGEFQRESLERFCDFLCDTKRVVILSQMDVAGKNYPLLMELLNAKKISYHLTEKSHAYIPLLGSWEDYFNQQSKNFRMDSRRKLKRLEKEGRVQLICQDGGEEAIAKLQTVAENSWQSNADVNIVSTEQGHRFYRAITQEWQGSHGFDFSFLEVDGKPLAYMVGIKSDGCYFAFDTAFDKNYSDYSPGLILHNFLLEKLYNEKMTCFDFGYVASYKRRWTEDVRMTEDITIFPSGIQVKLLFLANQLKQWVRKGRDK